MIPHASVRFSTDFARDVGYCLIQTSGYLHVFSTDLAQFFPTGSDFSPPMASLVGEFLSFRSRILAKPANLARVIPYINDASLIGENRDEKGMDCSGCGSSPCKRECGIGVCPDCGGTSAGSTGAGRERRRDIGWRERYVRRSGVWRCCVRRRHKRGSRSTTTGGSRTIPGITSWTGGRSAGPRFLCKSVPDRWSRGGSDRLCNRLFQQFQQHDDNEQPLTVSDRRHPPPAVREIISTATGRSKERPRGAVRRHLPAVVSP